MQGVALFFFRVYGVAIQRSIGAPAAGGGGQRIKGSTGRQRRPERIKGSVAAEGDLEGSTDQPAAEGGLRAPETLSFNDLG